MLMLSSQPIEKDFKFRKTLPTNPTSCAYFVLYDFSLLIFMEAIPLC